MRIDLTPSPADLVRNPDVDRWTASLVSDVIGETVEYDGSGPTIELALTALIETLATALGVR